MPEELWKFRTPSDPLSNKEMIAVVSVCEWKRAWCWKAKGKVLFSNPWNVNLLARPFSCQIMEPSVPLM
jgi:hypothetical protein